MLVGIPGLPQRVLRVVLLQAAVDQRHARVVVGLEIDLGEGLVTARSTVVAVAIGIQARGIQYEPCAVVTALCREVVLVEAVAAKGGFGPHACRPLPVPGKHLDHTTGVAAIQRRCRAAQHFDPVGHVQVQRGGLPLPVGRTGRYAVTQQLYAAHAKGRASTVTP
ncbi:hypothetical protein D3C80_854490 [compost metagenome]